MSKYNFIRQYKTLAVLIYSILLIYILIRAYTLSFTHDESLSYMLIQGNNTLRDDTANNHLFNTVLMSLSKNLFGTSEFSLRLPNVLSFIVYSIGCFFIFSTSKKIWLSLLGLVIILFNPFLIEFFSLARGYGLSLGFMNLSIYFMIRNETHNQDSSTLLRDYILSTLFASLAIYSNLALINFFVCVMIIFSVKYWFFRIKNNSNLNLSIKFWSIFFVANIALFLGIIRLFKLKESGQLYFGASSLIEGFDSLVSSSIYFQEYTSVTILTIKILIALFLSISFLYIIIKKKYNGTLFLITTLIAFLAIGLFIEDYIFEAKYPTERTALFYIPILAIFIYLLFLELIKQYEIKKQYYIPVISCLVIPILINFVASTNFTYTITWRYDSHTKNAMEVIKNHTQNTDQKLTVSNHWLFEPTINYYINHWNLKLNPANRNGITLSSDFIYRLDDCDTLNSFTILNTYDDINSNLLIKTESNK